MVRGAVAGSGDQNCRRSGFLMEPDERITPDQVPGADTRDSYARDEVMGPVRLGIWR